VPNIDVSVDVVDEGLLQGLAVQVQMV